MIEEMLSDKRQVNIEINEEPVFQVEIGSEVVIVNSYEEYRGPYTVTPSAVSHTLPTADKYVSKDIEVKEIPYAEVSNNAGGQTVTIGPMQ